MSREPRRDRAGIEPEVDEAGARDVRLAHRRARSGPCAPMRSLRDILRLRGAAAWRAPSRGSSPSRRTTGSRGRSSARRHRVAARRDSRAAAISSARMSSRQPSLAPPPFGFARIRLRLDCRRRLRTSPLALADSTSPLALRSYSLPSPPASTPLDASLFALAGRARPSTRHDGASELLLAVLAVVGDVEPDPLNTSPAPPDTRRSAIVAALGQGTSTCGVADLAKEVLELVALGTAKLVSRHV